MKTVNNQLQWVLKQFKAAKLYYGHGTDNAWDEAVYLVLSIAQLPPNMVLTQAVLDRELTTVECECIKNLVMQRIEQRIPLAYLIHEAWFAGRSFYVDERVLIPRSPIAELIVQHFSPWADAKHVHAILDIGTGSGCIAIACALTFPQVRVDAVDISGDALAVAKLNVERYQLTERVQLIASNLFSKLTNKSYDLIISNPPYVAQYEMAMLPAEYRHEPRLGLVAGEQGLDLVIPLLQQAAAHLNPQGVLIVEVGNSEVALQKRYPKVPFTWLEFQRGGGGVFLLTAEQLKTITL